MNKNYNNTELDTFLKESNNIEDERSDEAFKDAWNAWKFLECFDELTLNRVLECHRTLMLNLNKRIAGKLRDCNVKVGYRICPEYTLVSGLLNEWFVKHGNAITEEEIKKAHVAFEEIHPFEDSNGRTGRIIMNWQRIKNNLPLLIIHEGTEQYEYYKWFRSNE